MVKIKTLLIHPGLVPYRVDLFNRLGQEVDLNVVFLSDNIFYYPEFDLDNVKRSLRCRYQILPSHKLFKNYHFATALKKNISDFDPDVVVTHEFSYVTLWLILHRIFHRKRFAHLLWTTENVPLFETRGLIRRVIRKFCSSSVESLLVYSEEVAEKFINQYKIDPEKVFICSNLQQEEIFRAKLTKALTQVAQCIDEYNLGGKKVVLYVGRLNRRKNLKSLLKAFSGICTKDSSVVLAFVGEGPERKNLESLAVSLGIIENVKFLGHCQGYDLLVWYIIGSVFVLPSVWEPYGAVVNEALLSGMPVLCSSEAGSRVLINGGNNGYVYNPYDIKMLSALLEKILKASLPIDSQSIKTRESLMPVSFGRDLNSFLNAVTYAAKQKGF